MFFNFSFRNKKIRRQRSQLARNLLALVSGWWPDRGFFLFSFFFFLFLEFSADQKALSATCAKQKQKKGSGRNLLALVSGLVAAPNLGLLACFDTARFRV